MALEKMRAVTPLRGAGGNGPKNEHSGDRLDFQDKFSASNLQALRAAHLARRFRLTPALAAAVATLAYGEGRA
jgi:hypothetical protein